MKNLLIVAILLGTTSAYAGNYVCQNSENSISLKVVSENSIILNERDSGTVDSEYAKQNPEKRYYVVTGRFRSLSADGDGFTAFLTVSKQLFSNEKSGVLSIYQRANGFYQGESFDCHVSQ